MTNYSCREIFKHQREFRRQISAALWWSAFCVSKYEQVCQVYSKLSLAGGRIFL
jgi:hypothetical protein